LGGFWPAGLEDLKMGVDLVLENARNEAVALGPVAVLAFSVSAVEPPSYSPSSFEARRTSYRLPGLVGDQQPLFGHFSPTGLGIIVTKVSILALSGRLRTVQKRIEELEEEDEEAVMNIELADVLAPSRHKHEVSIWKGFGRNLRVGVLRDLAIISVQRVLELFAMEFLVDKKMGESLVKNIPRSSVRKWERFRDRSTLFYMSKVGASAFKGQIMFWLALFSVNGSIDVYYAYQESKDGTQLQRQGSETLGRKLLVNALRCSAACALAAVGAAVGSAIKPGIGTTLGLNIAPQFAFILIY